MNFYPTKEVLLACPLRYQLNNPRTSAFLYTGLNGHNGFFMVS